MIVYISIGNSDDKLCQADWAAFVRAVGDKVDAAATHVHGAWISYPADPWQNACWCVEMIHPEDASLLRGQLIGLAWQYRQDSIAWAEAPVTEFLPEPEGAR